MLANWETISLTKPTTIDRDMVASLDARLCIKIEVDAGDYITVILVVIARLARDV